MSPSKPTLVAHRGLATRRPENTAAAVTAAIEAGARYVEIDVQLSRDRTPFLFHDRTLERMCAQPGAMHEHTDAELAGLRASEPGKFGDRYADEPLATLAGVARLVAGHEDVFLFVELKRIAVEAFGTGAVLDAVLPAIEPLGERVALISFDVPVLAAARERCALPLGPVLETWEQRADAETNALDGEYVFVNHTKVPANDRFELGRASFVVYEVVDPALALELHARGAEFIETFAVDELARGLQVASNGGAS